MWMKRIPALVILAALLVPSAAQPCHYKMNVFNHRMVGDKLRLYMEMQTLAGSSASEVQLASFDTRHSAGKGVLKDIGPYSQKGNGLSTVLMLDRSGSMKHLQVKLREAAVQYVDSMEKGDEVGMLFFAQEKKQYGFSADPGELRNRVNGEIVGPRPKTMVPSDQTRLYSHLVDAIHLARDEGSRELKLILVMSDGEDEVHGYTPQEVIDEALKARVGIFAVGFRLKKNLKDLEQLRQIAEKTGGKYIEADASSDLAGIFVYARKRANGFLVLDEELCGLTKAEAAASPEMHVQVIYEDCQSNRHSVDMNLLEQDLPTCPNCARGGDGDCQDNESCVDGFCQKVSLQACQEARGHRANAVSCATNEDCSRYGDCHCEGGTCTAGPPPCKPWEKHDPAKNECVALPCDQGQTCPEGSECRDKKTCELLSACEPCQEKKDGVCYWVEDCKTDCRCAPGCLCTDGACIASQEASATTRPACEDCNAPMGGKCQVIECNEDKDCEASCVSAVCVCAAEKGLEAAEGAKKTCQPLREGPCDEPEEEVKRGDETMCRVIPCDKDAQCKEGGVCDDKTGECVQGGLWKRSPELVVGVAAGALVLIVVLIVVLLRMRRKDGLDGIAEEEPVTTSSRKDDTRLDEGSQGGGFQGGSFQGGGGAFGGTMQDSGAAQVGRRHKVTQVQMSPYVLVVQYSGNVMRHPLPFGAVTVGRETGDILIPNGIVSNPHLQLTVTPSGVTVADQGSTNGSFLGQMRLPPHSQVQLQRGQTLLLGSAVQLTLDHESGTGGTPSRKGATVIDR